MFFCFSSDYFVLALFAFVVLGLVSIVLRQEERLRNEMTHFLSSGTSNLNSVNQSRTVCFNPNCHMVERLRPLLLQQQWTSVFCDTSLIRSTTKRVNNSDFVFDVYTMTNGSAAERQAREWDTLLVRTWPLGHFGLLDFALYMTTPEGTCWHVL